MKCEEKHNCFIIIRLQVQQACAHMHKWCNGCEYEVMAGVQGLDQPFHYH